MKFLSFLVLVLFCTFTLVNGQNNLPRLSPKSFVGQTVGYTNVKIEYGSPGVKERKIWGELVPFNEVWRTGANEATTIEFDKDILIDGKKVPSGKYSLFTIPGKNKWTVILNNVYEQWGAYKYDNSQDLIRFTVIPSTNKFVERLRFTTEFIDAYKANINLEWENIKISFMINTEEKGSGKK